MVEIARDEAASYRSQFGNSVPVKVDRVIIDYVTKNLNK